MNINLNLAQKIDHTRLNPDATEADLKKLCDEARQYGFKTVCVQPIWIKRVSEFLKGSPVLPITVIGFPLGTHHSAVKVRESELALKDGALELDMVVQLEAVKAGRWKDVETDIAEVVKAAGKIPVKVILESCLLSPTEIIESCKASENAGAAFVKTSTGFSTGGATIDAVKLMRATVSSLIEVKASGGIRDLETALKMIEAGATRLGTSSGVSIIQGLKAKEGSY